MKKVIAALVVAAVGIGAVLWFKRTPSVPGPKIPKPFAQEHRLDEGTTAFFIESDTATVLAGSGIFYWPPQALPGGMAEEFDTVRKEKVSEILQLAKELSTNVEAARKELTSSRSAYFKFLDVLRASGAEGASYASASVAMIGGAAIRSEGAATAYLSASSVQPESAFAAAMIQECSVYAMAKSALELMQEADLIATHAAYAVIAAESSKDSKVKGAGKALEDSLSGSDPLVPSLTPVAETLTKIHNGLKQLHAAGYYYSRAVVEHVKGSLPGLEKAASSIKTNDEVEEEDIACAKAWVKFFGQWVRSMEQTLGSQNVKEFPAPVASYSSTYGLAFADDGEDWYSTGYRYLADKAQAYKEAVETVTETTFRVVKTGVQKGQRAIQFSTDAAGTLTKMGAQAAYHAYMGNTLQDLKDDLREYAGELRDNWNGKLPPKTTLRQAKEYLDDLEKAAEDMARGFSSTKTENRAIIWLNGKAAKLAVGAFTGLAKGIYLVSDPNSSKGDLLEGVLELALGSLGGSKSLLKPSEFPGAGKEILETGLAALKEMGRSFSRDGLRKKIGDLLQKMGRQGADDFGKWLSNMSELAASRQSLEALEAAGKAFRDQLKSKLAGFLEKVGDEMGKSLDDLFNKSFANNWKGLLSAYGSQTVGGGPIDLIDNILGAVLDDLFKEGMTGILDTRLESDDIRGLFSGTLVYTTIDFDEKQVRESNSEACLDFDFTPEMLEAIRQQLLNKPMAINIAVHPTGEDSGNVLISGKNMNATRIAYVYDSDGRVKGKITERGMTLHLIGSFKKEGGGVPPDGTPVIITFEGTISGDQPGVRVEGTVTGTKKG